MLNPTHSITRSLALTGLLIASSQTLRADYSSAVLADNPNAYYRLNDSTSRAPINVNSGSLGAPGNATNNLARVHPFPGAISGDADGAQFFDFSSRTEIPWNAAFNPPNTQPFTMEGWFYPASDQTGNGQCPVGNRYAWSGANRQGWVIFQRKPGPEYFGSEPVGWNFRMYNENGGSGGLEVTSLVPYQLAKWTHLVVVYDPVQLTNATLTMYVDGQPANTNTYNGGSSGILPGYVANSNDHAQPAANLALGNYNNTAGTSLNPYFGGIDEFAIYNAKLTSAQILAHYQNATNASRTTPYPNLVKSDNPVVYLRLGEIAPGPDLAVNLGETRASGLATNSAEVRYQAAGAPASRKDDFSYAYHARNGNSVTRIPYHASNNPPASVPFTFEAWLRPMRDNQGGQCPVNNRWVGGTGRTGWVIFQRNPNLTYPAAEGHGWNFRMFSGAGSSGQDVVTGVDYKIGRWQHLVVTWEPTMDNGDPAGNGNSQWMGTLTAYVDGVLAASNPNALYAANREVTETGSAAADLAFGSYNAASGLGQNPYEGDIDEVAFYSGYVLRPDQILEHYMAGTNSLAQGTNYETLVLTAAFTGPERQGPATYLKFSDPAKYSAANAGTAGPAANASLVLTTNITAGPRSPAFGGFDSTNTGLPLDGVKQWASLNNPTALNFTGQITLEAWIKPGTSQGQVARIISHGPETISAFLGVSPDNAVTNTSEVFLRIDDMGATYAVGSAQYDNGLVTTTTYAATAPMPAEDVGSTSWIHLAGTYDGANWRLYRNGVLVATQAAPVGALKSGGDWAIGSTGNGWADYFTGEIDEAAIYSTALTPAQIAAHYNAGLTAAKMTITRSGNNITITWPYGPLLQADNVTGAYTPVPGNPTSPYTTTIGSTRKFYKY